MKSLTLNIGIISFTLYILSHFCLVGGDICVSSFVARASSVSLFRKLIDTVDLSGYCRY